MTKKNSNLSKNLYLRKPLITNNIEYIQNNDTEERLYVLDSQGVRFIEGCFREKGLKSTMFGHNSLMQGGFLLMFRGSFLTEKIWCKSLMPRGSEGSIGWKFSMILVKGK